MNARILSCIDEVQQIHNNINSSNTNTNTVTAAQTHSALKVSLVKHCDSDYPARPQQLDAGERGALRRARPDLKSERHPHQYRSQNQDNTFTSITSEARSLDSDQFLFSPTKEAEIHQRCQSVICR